MSGVDLRFGAKLGRGPVGASYLAERPGGVQQLVKVMASSFHGQPKLLAEVLAEARGWGNFRHPNVAATVEVGTHEGRQVIVMDPVPGQTLERHLAERGPLDARAAVRVVRDLAQALAAAHAIGLAHGDIRPAKVHLDNGRGVLLDLGLSRAAAIAAGFGRFGVQFGHPDYMAPEAIGQPGPTAAADVYALGLLLYTMLVGTAPFRGDVESVLVAQRAEPLPPAPALAQSPALARFLARLTAKVPLERFPDAQGVLGGLYELVGQAPPVAAPRMDTGQWRRAAVEQAAAAPGAAQWQAAPVAPDLSAGERTSTILSFTRPTAPIGSGMDTPVPGAGARHAAALPPPMPGAPPPMPGAPRPMGSAFQGGAPMRPGSGVHALGPGQPPTGRAPAVPQAPQAPGNRTPAHGNAASGGFARAPGATPSSVAPRTPTPPVQPPRPAAAPASEPPRPATEPPRPATDPPKPAAKEMTSGTQPALALGMTLDDTSSAAAPPAEGEAPKKPVAVRLGKKIGEGPVGSTYEGDLKDHPGPVAIKVISQRFGKHPEILQRILDTVRKVAGFVDPRVVAVLHVVHVGGRDAIVSEHAAAGTLREVLSTRGKLPPIQVIDLLRDLALALQVARGRDLSHGDLRPEKVYLTPGSPARLADFGLAEAAGLGAGFGQYGAPWGHPGYLAPEVVADPKRAPDFASDVYALGITAYELSCGKRPFEGATPRDVLRQHLETPLPPPPAQASVPGPLAELILRLTAKDPKRRADAPGELITQLDRCKRQVERAATAVAAPPVEEFDLNASGEKGEGWIKQDLPKPKKVTKKRDPFEDSNQGEPS